MNAAGAICLYVNCVYKHAKVSVHKDAAKIKFLSSKRSIAIWSNILKTRSIHVDTTKIASLKESILMLFCISNSVKCLKRCALVALLFVYKIVNFIPKSFVKILKFNVKIAINMINPTNQTLFIYVMNL